MTQPPLFIFIDDDTREKGDAEEFKKLLNLPNVLRVELRKPDRNTLLVSEEKLEEGIAGFILDISLSDHVQNGDERFIGTGAGLAQDIRLLQSLGEPNGQKPRPIVRLCATKVFQDFLKGDTSSWDIFDLGYDKETIGDLASSARREIASLVDIYDRIVEAVNKGGSDEASNRRGTGMKGRSLAGVGAAG